MISKGINQLRQSHQTKRLFSSGEIEWKEAPKALVGGKQLFQDSRYPIDFKRELDSLELHAERISRPGLGFIVNKIYIPKFQAKRFAPYLYAGESDLTYKNYRKYTQTKGPRDSKGLILGIESSFDDSCSAVVSGSGQVLSNEIESFKENFYAPDAPLRAQTHHQESIPKVVERALEKSGIGSPSDLEAIAVTIGPGQKPSLSTGIDFAKALGDKFDLPVIPVNHIEAHVLTPRMLEENQGKAEFPFLSVLVTGGHTEIVLTRGPGLHTIIGFTIDIPVGVYIDSVAKEVRARTDILNDQEQSQKFISKYNKENPQDKIEADYFTKLMSSRQSHGGKLLEKLARYGTPTEYELPIPQKLDSTANMSFTGLQTSTMLRFYKDPEEGSFKSRYEQDKADLSFSQVLNLCSSAQFAAFAQISRKVQTALAYCFISKIPLTSVSLCGGVSCNEELRFQISQVAKEFNLPTVVAPPNLCTDNAAMVAWTGWELKYANQEVDIRNIKIEGLKKIPLGSFVSDPMNFNKSKTIMNKRQLQQVHGNDYLERRDQTVRRDQQKQMKLFLGKRQQIYKSKDKA